MSEATKIITGASFAQGGLIVGHGMPPSIRVGTVTYRVTDNPDEWMRKEHSEQNTSRIGMTDNGLATIYLKPDAPGDVKRITLWHEVLHAVCYAVMGSPDWRHLGEERNDREESVVSMLEHPTLAVLRDNPALVRYLMGDA